MLFSCRQPEDSNCVITSYSIHYTKLYEDAKKYIEQKLGMYKSEGLITEYDVKETINNIEKMMNSNNEFKLLLNSYRTIDGLLHEYFPQKETIINNQEFTSYNFV